MKKQLNIFFLDKDATVGARKQAMLDELRIAEIRPEEVKHVTVSVDGSKFEEALETDELWKKITVMKVYYEKPAKIISL